ncbi:hypothetical protein, conserved [Trypanosoma brucei gambiense DAL972]|uniref:SKP1 component dimerisation domain-containing protein n=1 Tax=Trypanosoma brucei gambiense (strain MHOM/CI/86/DAL972) TaxID=679716 RepID=D0A4V7_TRYB9|nr:hypothetical protein, conserved [Trypanosoma brucei gambiense DAL972]CBH16301.1 hypothetical protein, conserved [Trypanosoma brucei gambiense DAL972]|eukprot:XP_011778565.1 hypothetical protein, conserved [Trypanosoma brucei gambiense DAL972]
MVNHLVVLIGSDGKRATVSRTAATHASLLLRDLLDGREPNTTVVEGKSGVEHVSNSDIFEGLVVDKEVVIPAIEIPFTHATGSLLQRVCAHMTYRYDYRPPNGGAEGSTVLFEPVAREHRATFSCGGGYGRNVMPEIPRPMVLPLVDYLDSFDKRFIEDWDEITTVQMVKLATLLNYEELLNLASAKLAVYLSEKSIEGLRAFLGVENDFKAEEEAELRKEYGRMSEEK